MLFNSPQGTQTITVLRKGATQDWAGDFAGGTNEFSESHKIEHVRVEYGAMSGEKFREDSTRSSGTLYMPMGSDLKASDKVELENGDRLNVFGKPWTYNLGLIRGTAVRFREFD